MQENKVVFSVLTVNHPGVLLRVTGLFSRRGFNIDSIVACKTQTPEFSRWTLVVTGDEATFIQLNRQLLKMEDVLTVEVLEPDSCTCSELLLLKLDTEKAGRSAVLRMAQTYGGRVLDGCPATAEVLPEIVEAVEGRVPVLVDGGIRSGTDIFRALALGAQAVVIARPYVCAVYGGGAEGAVALTEKLKNELADTMQMCGVHSLAEIDRSCVRM